MVKIVKGDITTAKHGVLCHQVNCKGVMGAGLARQLRTLYPAVYTDYINSQLVLGNVIFTEVKPNLVVASLCAQYEYGHNKTYTNYQALEECFVKVKEYSEKRNIQVGIPYGIGCGLAGGDWSVVYFIIGNTIPNAIIVVR